MTTIATVTATIPARGTISGSAAITGPVVGLITPAVWAPAVVTVQASVDGTNFYDLYDGMTAKELSFNIKPNSYVAIAQNRLLGCAAIKLRSGTSAQPVAQNVACQFGLIVQGP
jgi:hypothetical protein